MAKIECKVSVEAELHKGLKKLFQDFSDEHGIQIESIDIDWMDVSTNGCPRHIIRTFEEKSFSKWNV